MSALGHAIGAARRSRRAKLGLASAVAAVIFPLVAATGAHAAVASPGIDTAPLDHIKITEPYGVPGPWAAGYHTGVDLAAAVGTPIHSIAEGTVVHSGWGGAYGNDVIVKLTDGKYALYAHLSHISVAAGEHVTEGQQLGLSGATGHVTGPHLHFEVRRTTSYGSDVNPVSYLRAHGVNI